MKIKLVENKGTLHKTYTILFSAFLILLSLLEIIELYIPALMPVIPDDVFPWVSAGLGVAIGVGRYVKQDLSDGKLDGRIEN